MKIKKESGWKGERRNFIQDAILSVKEDSDSLVITGHECIFSCAKALFAESEHQPKEGDGLHVYADHPCWGKTVKGVFLKGNCIFYYNDSDEAHAVGAGVLTES